LNLVPKINILLHWIERVSRGLELLYQEAVNRRNEIKEIITRQVPIESDLSKCSNEYFKL
jgi:hypothetical protein